MGYFYSKFYRSRKLVPNLLLAFTGAGESAFMTKEFELNMDKFLNTGIPDPGAAI